MRFVAVEHPDLGRTRVPESRLAHLGDGWEVVDGDRPVADPEPPVEAVDSNHYLDFVEAESQED